MEWDATARVEMVNVDMLLAIVPLPSAVVPSWNVTGPVGVPPPGVVTLRVAEKVTLWPETEGLAELVSATLTLPLANLNTVPPPLPPVPPPKKVVPYRLPAASWIKPPPLSAH